jgi:4-azaleucine resistance transporter AzlC
MLETAVSQDFRRGLRSALPIAIGYVPVAITFGILGRTAGLDLSPVIAMSVFVFAGAAQFMALSLMVTGAGAGQIVLAVFLLNLRHLLFSANLSRKLPVLRTVDAAVLAFGVTDEVFSVASTEPRVRPRYLLGLEFGAWSAWSGGTLLGYLAGNLLQPELAAAFSTGLYALFASLAVWQVRTGGLRMLIVVVIASGANIVLRNALGITAGWAFVIAMLIASVAGLAMEGDGDK